MCLHAAIHLLAQSLLDSANPIMKQLHDSNGSLKAALSLLRAHAAQRGEFASAPLGRECFRDFCKKRLSALKWVIAGRKELIRCDESLQ